MECKTVTTKEELKRAQESGVQEIIIKGELANKLKKAKRITKLGFVAMAALTATIAGIIATPVTAPSSGGMALGFTAASTVATATMTGMEIATIIFISTIGLGLIIALFKGYEEIEFSSGKMVLRKKAK